MFKFHHMQDARTGFEKAWLRRDLLQLKVFRKNAVVMDWKLSIANIKRAILIGSPQGVLLLLSHHQNKSKPFV